jgi:hypothetical protein
MQIKSPATDSASAPFRFATGNSFAFEIDSTTDALVIDASARIGIGTDTPDTLMELVGANPILTIRDTDTGISTNDARLRLAESGASSSLDNYFDLGFVAGKFTIGSNAVADALTINRDTGSVGIGTAAPSDILEIHGSGTKRITIRETTSTKQTKIVNTSTGGAIVATSGNSSGNNLQFHTQNGSTTTEAMRIDSNGNVGINTDSPDNALHVVTPSFGGINIESTGATSDPTLTLTNDVGGASAWQIQMDKSSGNSLQVRRNNVEQIRIDTSGNLLVGKTALSTSTVGIQATEFGGLYATRSSGAPLICNRTTTDGTAAVFMRSAVTVGTISITGSSTAYNTSSDYRLKEAWVPMAGASARVQNLKPVNFAWKVDGSRVDGFLAHELADVVPEAVTGAKDAMTDEEYEVTPAVLDEEGAVVTEAVMGTRSVPDMQAIDQSKLVPLLTASLQEALTKIDDLEARLTALES